MCLAGDPWTGWKNWRIYGTEDAWVYAGAYQSFFRADDSVTNEDVKSVVQDRFSVGGMMRLQPLPT